MVFCKEERLPSCHVSPNAHETNDPIRPVFPGGGSQRYPFGSGGGIGTGCIRASRHRNCQLRPGRRDCQELREIVSCAQDEGIARNSGRIGAALGPESIRRALYRLAKPSVLKAGDLFDLGDTFFDASLEEVHERHCTVVGQLLKDGKKVVVLGGGNDLSYPDDKVKAADAPGVSAPSPTGLSAEEAQILVDFFSRDVPATVLELTEVNPRLDIDNRTSKLAAVLIHTFLSSMRKE
ncbi:MAG: hypothetical protein GY866_09230 [Proteobacteria bacterium]|nr:hypothetical protein [Pseudomonadota bacterium]